MIYISRLKFRFYGDLYLGPMREMSQSFEEGEAKKTVYNLN